MFTTNGSLATMPAVSDGGITSWILKLDQRLQSKDVSASWQRKPRRQRRPSRYPASAGVHTETRVQVRRTSTKTLKVLGVRLQVEHRGGERGVIGSSIALRARVTTGVFEFGARKPRLDHHT